MKTRNLLTAAALLGGFILAYPLMAADVTAGDPAPDKVLVTDGRVSHTIGNLDNHVTNWGLIGSRPSVATPYSHAPSARWRGVDYLWASGVWFGGIVLGEPLVTTGQYQMEFMASPAPGDTIFGTYHGAPGGNRYPWAGADDDGDGAEDEDPLDGLDNDNDGLIDEDFAAVSDQSFRSAMADTHQSIRDIYPDHTPLNLEIVQETYQWDSPIGEDFIGYEYRVTNIGNQDIEGFHCGIFSDFDILDPSDDMAGSWNSAGTGYVRNSWGAFVPVFLGWMYDGASTGAAPGLVGYVLCGVETNAAAGGPDNPLAMHSYQIFSGNLPFENGGDPTNDAERYELLQLGEWDADTLPGRESDYRTLMSTQAVPALAPGESVNFRFAMVIADNLDDLLVLAANAVTIAQGQCFDRDGDPANGAEHCVPWLHPDEVPVPAVTGRLQAHTGAGSVALAFDVRAQLGARAEVERRASASVPFRAWSLDQGSGRVVDDDAVGWPRTYDLKLKSAGDPDLVLDTVEVPGPVAAPLQLAASPNPFNPRLMISYALPAAGRARLEILDLKGRLVKVLFDETRGAGEDRIAWNGVDERGRAAASGVYLVRLVTGDQETRQQVTLVR
jgi:hypothetical protein